MKNCRLKDEWSKDFHKLSEEEIEELLDHADECEYHEGLLEGYNRKILPDLHAGMPDYVLPASVNLLNRKTVYITALHYVFNKFCNQLAGFIKIFFSSEITTVTVKPGVTYLKLSAHIIPLFIMMILLTAVYAYFYSPKIKDEYPMANVELQPQPVEQAKDTPLRDDLTTESQVNAPATPQENATIKAHNRQPKQPPDPKVIITVQENSIDESQMTKSPESEQLPLISETINKPSPENKTDANGDNKLRQFSNNEKHENSTGSYKDNPEVREFDLSPTRRFPNDSKKEINGSPDVSFPYSWGLGDAARSSASPNVNMNTIYSREDYDVYEKDKFLRGENSDENKSQVEEGKLILKVELSNLPSKDYGGTTCRLVSLSLSPNVIYEEPVINSTCNWKVDNTGSFLVTVKNPTYMFATHMIDSQNKISMLLQIKMKRK